MHREAPDSLTTNSKYCKHRFAALKHDGNLHVSAYDYNLYTFNCSIHIQVCVVLYEFVVHSMCCVCGVH
jgi:hypothetical protein